MKNIRYLILLGSALASAVLFQGCDDDEGGSSLSGASFARTISSFSEGEGDGTVEIAIDGYNGSEEGIEFDFSGTALEGADYEVVGFADGVLTIDVLEDDSLEITETIRVQIVSADGGVGRSRLHTLSIYSNCEDVDGLDVSHFDGDWDAIEYYCGFGVTTGSCDYGPYDAHLVQNASNPNRFDFDNFYDSGYDVYMIVDMAAGTVSFPNQNAVGDASNPAITASTGTFDIDLCEGTTTMTINLNYDGADWVYYFSKH